MCDYKLKKEFYDNQKFIEDFKNSKVFKEYLKKDKRNKQIINDTIKKGDIWKYSNKEDNKILTFKVITTKDSLICNFDLLKSLSSEIYNQVTSTKKGYKRVTTVIESIE